MGMNIESLAGGSLVAVIGLLVIFAFLSDGTHDDGSQPTGWPAGPVSDAPELPANAVYLQRGILGMTPAQPASYPPEAAAPVGDAGVDAVAPTGEPPNYVAPDIQLSEAHWQGMDTMRLTQELRQKLKLPRGLQGILVDEVTLNAARSGLLAGDVIIAVEDGPVTTLEEFQRQTKIVRNRSHALITVMRKSGKKEDRRYSMSRRTLVLRANGELGFAQMETAPMILPGAGRPHDQRGPCTSCHAIGRGFELAPDPDGITLPPPPLSMATIGKQPSPHRDRGSCEACHMITP